MKELYGLSSGERSLWAWDVSTSTHSQRANDYLALGYRVSDVLTVLGPSGTVTVNGVWQPSSTIGATTYRRGYLPADFVQTNTQLSAQGWSIHDLSTSLRADGTVRVDAVWRPTSVATTTWVRGYATSDFANYEATQRAQGWGLHRLLTSLRADGTVRVDAVWHANTASNTKWVRGYLQSDFIDTHNSLSAQGWIIASVATSPRADGSVRIDAIWHKNIQSRWVQGYAVDDFVRVESDFRCQGWTLEQIHWSYASDGTQRIDAVWR